jgi:hypothetical protein
MWFLFLPVATYYGAPAVVGATLGISAAGPVAGGVFAGMQAAAAATGAAGLVAGSTAAVAQSVAMAGVSAATLGTAAAAGATLDFASACRHAGRHECRYGSCLWTTEPPLKTDTKFKMTDPARLF